MCEGLKSVSIAPVPSADSGTWQIRMRQDLNKKKPECDESQGSAQDGNSLEATTQLAQDPLLPWPNGKIQIWQRVRRAT